MGLSPVDAAVILLDQAWALNGFCRGLVSLDLGSSSFISGKISRVGVPIEQRPSSHDEADGALLLAGWLRYWGPFRSSP